MTIKEIVPVLGLYTLLSGCFAEVNSNEFSSAQEAQYSQVQNRVKCIHDVCLDEPIHEEHPDEQATSSIQSDDVVVIHEDNYYRRYQSREYRVF